MSTTYLVELDGGIQDTSATTLTIGIATKTLVMASRIKFPAGMTVTLDAGNGNTMTGTVSSYSWATMTLVVVVTATAGAGSFAVWTIWGQNTWYFSDTGYVDPLRGVYYQPRLIQPLDIKRVAFSTGSTSAQGYNVSRFQIGGAEQATTFGNIKLSNLAVEGNSLLHPAGELDAFLDYGFDGWAIREYLVDSQAAFTDALRLFTGVVLDVLPDFNDVTLQVADTVQALAYRKLQTNRFLGLNIGPNGVEGDPSQIGKPKPKLFGVCLNCSPVLANAELAIYMCADAAVTIDAFFDGGSPLGVGSTRANLRALQTNAPSVGTWDVYAGPEGTFVRVNKLSKSPTFNGHSGNGTTQCTAAQVFYQIANGPGGIAASGISSADITALDALNGHPVQGYFDSDSTVKDALDLCSSAVGAWYGLDNTGLLRLKRLDAPAAAQSVLRLRLFNDGLGSLPTDGDITSIQRAANFDQGASIPSFRASLNHSPNPTVQAVADLTGDPTSPMDIVGGLARRNWLAKPFTTTPATSGTVLNIHKMSPELVLTSYLALTTCSVVAQVTGAIITAGGTGYGSPPGVTFAAPAGGGVTATGTARISGILQSGMTLTGGGTGYQVAPTVVISDATGSGCVVIALINNGAVVGFTVTDTGHDYLSPTVSLVGPCTTRATATATASIGVVTSILITNGGTTYTGASLPAITFGSGAAAATATVAAASVTIDPNGYALAEAQRLQALYGVRRDLWEIQVHFSTQMIGVIDLGTVVTLLMPRFGCDFGRPVAVLAIGYDARTYIATLTCWG